MALQNAFSELATDVRVDETSALLRRIIKIMESQATVDGQNRQRIVVDAITGALTLATLSTITNAVPVGNVATIASYDGRQFIDIARTAFNTGIRSKLT